MDIMNNQILHFDSYNWKHEVLWWKENFEDTVSYGLCEMQHSDR